MSDVFAVTGRGLEELCAEEMARLPGVQVRAVSYRRVTAHVERDIGLLLDLRIVDDVFLHLADWGGILTHRSMLAQFKDLAGRLRLQPAVRTIAALRPLKTPPSFSVTANFVGKRNYSSDEIKQAVAEGIAARSGWSYTSEDLSDLNLRVFIEHEEAYIGLRLGAVAQHNRAYKQEHIPGSLKPPVAAAMLAIAKVEDPRKVLDPFCGAGTILIEAASRGILARGGDMDLQALGAAEKNARKAGVGLQLGRWDARRLPLAPGVVECIVTNLPWGRQVQVGEEMIDFYSSACAEFERVLAPDGCIVLLTSLADLVKFDHLRLQSATQISLFGQQPVILRYGNQETGAPFVPGTVSIVES